MADVVAEGASVVEGNFFNALAQDLDRRNGVYTVIFTRNDMPVKLNPVKRTGKYWRSASIRYYQGKGYKAVRIAGVLSCWVNHDHSKYMLAYADGAVVAQWFDHNITTIDPELRNKIMHALNGNIRCFAADWQHVLDIARSQAAMRHIQSMHDHQRATGQVDPFVRHMLNVRPPAGPFPNHTMDRPVGPAAPNGDMSLPPPGAGEVLTRAERNRRQHAKNGNTTLKPLSAYDNQDFRFGFYDADASEHEDDDVSIQSEFECLQAPLAEQDLLIFAALLPRLTLANSQKDPKSFFDAMSSIDAFGPRESKLSSGWSYDMPDLEKVKDKKSKVKSPSQKKHSDGRMRNQLDSMTVESAEAWVIARKPNPQLVPRRVDSDYLCHYVDRSTRAEVYAGHEESGAVFNFLANVADRESGKTVWSDEVWSEIRRIALKDCEVMWSVSNKDRNKAIKIVNGNTAVHALRNGNYGLTNCCLQEYQSAFLNCVAATTRVHDNSILTSAFAYDSAQFNPLAGHSLQPCPVPHHTLGFCTDDTYDCDFYASLGFVDPDYRSPVSYERHFVANPAGHRWMVEVNDAGGMVTGIFPREVTDGMRLMAKISVLNADGNPDLGKPVLYVFDRRALPIPWSVPYQTLTVHARGLNYHAFIGPRNVKLHVVETGESVQLPRDLYNQVSRTYGRAVPSASCTSNIQAILTSGDVKMTAADMAHITNFCYLSALPAAQISAATASPFRDRLLAAARTGKPLGSFWDHVLCRFPASPVYTHVYGREEPNWMLVYATRGACLVGGGLAALYTLRAGSRMFLDVTSEAADRAAGAVTAALPKLPSLPSFSAADGSMLGPLYLSPTTRLHFEKVNDMARRVTGTDRTWLGRAYDSGRTSAAFLDYYCTKLFRSSGFNCSLTGHWTSPFLEEAACAACPPLRLLVALVELRQKGFYAGLMGFWSHLIFQRSGRLALPFHLAHNAFASRGRIFFMNMGMGYFSRYDLHSIGFLPDPTATIKVKEQFDSLLTKAKRVIMLAPSVLDMSSYASNRGNKLHSCHGRVCKPTPEITDRDLFDQVAREMELLGQKVREAGVEEEPWDTFVARFPPAKRVVYEEAKDTWEALGMGYFHTEFGRQNFVRANFIKHELNPYRLDVGQFRIAPSDPRTISPMTYVAQAVLGPWILGFTVAVKRILEDYKIRGRRVIVVSGLSVSEMSDLLRSALEHSEEAVVVCGDDALFSLKGLIYYVDGKRWDAHYRNQYHYAKIRMYLLSGMPPFMATILFRFLLRVMTWRSGVSCRIKRNVTSGDADTTIGNGVTNAVVICVCADGATDFSDFCRRTHSIGFEYEMAAAHRDLRPAGDFCARVWLPGPKGFEDAQLVMKFGRLFGKAAWSANLSCDPDALLKYKLENVAMDCACFPELSQKFKRAADGINVGRPKVVQDLDHYVPTGDLKPVPAEDFFAERYACSYSDVLVEVDTWLAALRSDDWEINTPTLRRIAEIDYGLKAFEGPLGRIADSAVPDLKPVPLQEYQSEARETRVEYIWLQIKLRVNKLMHALVGNNSAVPDLKPVPLQEYQSEARETRVEYIWLQIKLRMNKLVHALVGNGRSLLRDFLMFVLWSFVFFNYEAVGGSGPQIQTCREVPRYHRTVFTLISNHHIMPNRKRTPAAKGKGKKPRASFSNSKPKAKVTGQGAYGMANLAKALAGAVTARMAKTIPKGTFEKKGASIGRGLSRFTGFGDYVMNDIVHKVGTPSRGGTPSQTISNCEYIRDIVAPGSMDFTLQQLAVNAAAVGTFPWLASISRLYTKYRVKQLLFEYRSMSSDYSSNVGLGSVIMAPLYNVTSSDFNSKQQMEAAAHAVSFKPSNSCVCGIECAPQDNNFKWYNVRNESGSELTPFTDPCKFYYAIYGCPAAAGTVLGELWVHYTMELIEPVIAPNQSNFISQAASIRAYGTVAGTCNVAAFGLQGGNTLQNNPTWTAPPGTISKTITTAPGKPQSNVSYFVSLDTANQNNIWFAEPGSYVLTWTCAFTVAPTAQSTVNFWQPTTIYGATITTVAANAYFTGTDRKTWMQTIHVTTTSPHSAVTFTPSSGLTGLASTVVENTTSGSVLTVYKLT